MDVRFWLLASLGFSVSCSCGLGPGGGGGGGGDGGDFDERPFRDEWVQEAVIDFVHTGPDGEILISDVIIGGQGGDNFGNRGDVIVRFDGEPDIMTVELRRFVMAGSQVSAAEQLGGLKLWAYEGTVALPDQKDAEDECLDEWRTGCQLRVYADALLQREVSGADIRVTLPPDFRGLIDVETEDDSAHSDYLNRGDVCIDGLPGSADIVFNSGRAFVRMAEDVTPTPTCPAQDVAACETWTTPDENGEPVLTPWTSDCPCTTAGHQFGRVTVDSRNVDPADIVVDVPTELWGSLLLENRFSETTDRECEARLSLPESILELDPQDSAARIVGSMNYPGYPAISGAGYRIALQSGTCGPVGHTDAPEDFDGDGPASSERRGYIEVCTDCIIESCDALVP